jgi:hypothetical protein
VILAELNIRHTRRHMPTRRVALDASYLPMNGSAYGAALLSAVVAENIEGLDDEQVELLPKFMKAALDGFHVPRIGLRYRLQTDVHGLDLSRHRLLEDSGVLVMELDVHAAQAPQVIGAVMAAAAMGPTTRRKALRAIDAAIAQPGVIPEPFLVRRLLHGVPSERPPMAASGPVGPINGVILPDAAKWAGVPSERRWAMEVLGIGADMNVDRTDIQKRFRRLLRTAHPDHGGASAGAAERIAELTEARELLFEGLAPKTASADDDERVSESR